MSDCSANAWRVPEQREPGVLYMHGHPGTDYAAVRAVEVDGQRFERVLECELTPVKDYRVSKCVTSWGCVCSSCGGFHEFNHGKRWDYCPLCGAKVVDE